MTESYKDGEVYEAVLPKAVADIASAYEISNEEAFKMIQDSWKNDPESGFIECETKSCQFWVEQVL